LSAHLVPLADLEDRDLAAWRELADRTVEANPFFDPDYVLPAARGLGEWDDVAVLSVRNGSDWTACLPVRRYSRWHRLPLPCLATWQHSYCLLGTPLLAAEKPQADLMAILGDMLNSAGRTSFAALEWVPADGSIGEALQSPSLSRPLLFDEFSRATLKRRPEATYLEGRLKGKHRREFRRLAQGLEEELGGSLALVDRSSEGDAVETFMELEASGWKGREGTALSCEDGHAGFFREMTRAFVARGALELLFLEAGDQVVAARCSLLGGGASFCFKVAYDERFKRFSPGRELELRLIERFHDSELEWMDSCADLGNELFNRLWPDRRTLVTVAYPATGPFGLVAVPAIRGAVAVRDRRRRGSAVD
jgi:CelD/BcsL family acetyltransferase involved in cellulose biosynthesis